MSDQPVLLQLPQELYERAHQIAEESDRAVESVLIDSLALLFGTRMTEDELMPELLQSLTDEALWAVVRRPLAWGQDIRLRELTAQSKARNLTPDEEIEIDQLVEAYDRYVLLRSQALMLLKSRGQDVERRLKLGA